MGSRCEGAYHQQAQGNGSRWHDDYRQPLTWFDVPSGAALKNPQVDREQLFLR